MCGAVMMDFDQISKQDWLRFFNEKEVADFEEQNNIILAFWHKQPVLPVELQGEKTLIEWGNRDKSIKLPKTGWARLESLEAGKWNYLNPQVVKIPAALGYEKKVWFPLESEIRGVLITKDELTKVYMITQTATDEYKILTGHDRMPRMMKEQTFRPIGEEK